MGKPASGIPAKGASKHGKECGCVRCTGFQPGHRYAVGHGRPPVHGALAKRHTLAKAERTLELAEAIRNTVPVRDAADDFTIQSLAVLLVRVERATAALDELEARFEGQGPLAAYTAEDTSYSADGLRKDLRSWLSVAERYFSALGMTPASRARLGLDIARARRLTVAEWHEQAALEEAG